MDKLQALIDAGNALALLLASRSFQLSDREQHDVIDAATSRWHESLAALSAPATVLRKRATG